VGSAAIVWPGPPAASNNDNQRMYRKIVLLRQNMDSPGLIVLIFPNPLKKATIDPTLNKTETYQPAMKSAPCGHPFAAGARQNSARLEKRQ